MEPEFRKYVELMGNRRVDYMEKFYQADKGSRGYLEFGLFKNVLLKINPSYDSNSKDDDLINLVRLFAENVPGSQVQVYNYNKFSDKVQDYFHYSGDLQGLFQRLFQEMKLNRNTLFKNFVAIDPQNTGVVPGEQFRSVFNKSVRTPLSKDEVNVVEFFFSADGSSRVSYRKFEESFKQYLSKIDVRYEDLTTKKNIGEDIERYWGREVFINFIEYFRKHQIKEPLLYFDRYQRDRRDDTTTHYSFQEAVYQVVPKLLPDDFKRLESELETKNGDRISLKEFENVLEEVRRTMKDGEKELYADSAQAYDGEKVGVFNKISEQFLDSCKLSQLHDERRGLKQQLMQAQFGCVDGRIRRNNFLDFLKNIKLDVEDVGLQLLDKIFKPTNSDNYNVQELLEYYAAKVSAVNDSIFDKSQESVRRMLEELNSHIVVSQKRLFKSLVEEDMDHDGMLKEDSFRQVTSFHSIPFDQPTMELIKIRYNPFRDGRLNVLHLIYDMYLLKKHTGTPPGTFADLLVPRPQPDVNDVMFDFCNLMHKQEISAEGLAGELVELSRRRRIKTSYLLLKVIDILKYSIFNSKPADISGRGANAAFANKSPLDRILDVIEVLDDQTRGNVMDFDLVTKLNHNLNYRTITFLRSVITQLSDSKLDFRGYITSCIGQNESVNLPKLESFFLTRGFQNEIVQEVFTRLKLKGLADIQLHKLQTKLEHEMKFLQIVNNAQILRQYIWGQQANAHISTEELGVDRIITSINQGLNLIGKSFEAFFNYPFEQFTKRADFNQRLSNLSVQDYSQASILMSLCEDKINPGTVNMGKVKEIYDSKYGFGGSAFTNTSSELEATTKNLKATIKNMGHNLKALYNKADVNHTNSLDRRELFFLLSKLDDTIKQSESNLIFDQVDRDRNGTISFDEFERFFKVESSAVSGSVKIEGLKWAAAIFRELNKSLEDAQ